MSTVTAATLPCPSWLKLDELVSAEQLERIALLHTAFKTIEAELPTLCAESWDVMKLIEDMVHTMDLDYQASAPDSYNQDGFLGILWATTGVGALRDTLQRMVEQLNLALLEQPFHEPAPTWWMERQEAADTTAGQASDQKVD